MIEIGPNLAAAMKDIGLCLFGCVLIWAFYKMMTHDD